MKIFLCATEHDEVKLLMINFAVVTQIDFSCPVLGFDGLISRRFQRLEVSALFVCAEDLSEDG